MREIAQLLAFLLGVFLIAPVVVLGSLSLGELLCGPGTAACAFVILVGVCGLSGVLIWRREGAGKIR